MLGLWSTAAQLRACHCRACLRATNTVARRSATATTSNPRRRKFLASDVFTACYTAIMATAAVVDAGRKDKRRRDLDREIAQAKGSLAMLLEDSHARDLAQVVTTSNSEPFYGGSMDKIDVLSALCNTRPPYLQKMKSNSESRRHAIARLRRSLDLQWTPELPEATSTWAKCEEIVALEERNPGVPHREPRTETQLGKTTDMINDLVDGLLEKAYWQVESEAPTSHPSLDSPDSARTMIRFLRSDGYPSYTHPEVDMEETAAARARLNEVNSNILADWTPPYRERFVAKICYNLLVCGVPPAIQNYNTLILRFTQLGEHKLAQVVVDSFLHKSHLKPTEATILCLLHHYRMKGDILGFWGLLRRLFGHDPRGIGLRRRKADEVAKNSYIRSWVAVKDITVINDYYIESVELNQNIVESMMDGLIDFSMLREAAKLLSVCLQEKWAVSADILKRLLHACITSLDDTAARVIIQGLLNNISQTSSMLLGPEPVSHSTIRQLRHLLNICQGTSPLQKDLSLNTPASPGSQYNLDRLATAIWIRDKWEDITFMIERLETAKQALLETELPLSDRLDRAIEILDSRHHVVKLWKTERTQRLARIDWLETQCAASAKQIEAAENVICNTLAKHTPRAVRNWRHFSPAVPIEHRVERAMASGTPGSMQHQMAVCFARKKDLDAELKAGLMKALPPHLLKPLVATRNDSGDVSLKRVMEHFNRYVTAVRKQQREEAAAEAAARACDPFHQLLDALPKPGISFWQRAPPASAAAGSGQGW